MPATRAKMQATKSMPIVMVGVGNPIELPPWPHARDEGRVGARLAEEDMVELVWVECMSPNIHDRRRSSTC